jgi:hypothetical protein
MSYSSYSEWAGDLMRRRPRAAGAYLMALGTACLGVMYGVFRFSGMAFMSFVPIVCLLFGAWHLVLGRPADRYGRVPWWYRQGVLATIVVGVVAGVTARSWLPLLLSR